MITDDERRRATLELRTINCCIHDWAGADVRWYISKAAFGDEYLRSQSDLLDRLADLIEPCPERTCRNMGGEEDSNAEYYDFYCSECGYGGDVVDPSYCPGCGAKVVEDGHR